MRLGLLLTILFSLLSSTAWATKSRLEALGQSSNGSFFLRDERNVFLNPAHIHLLDRRLSFEWGDSGDGFKADAVATPKAEGGWWDGKASTPHLIYLGNENEEAIFVRNVMSSGSALKPDNTIDVTWGVNPGGMNRYGFGINFSKNQDEVTGGIDRSETFAGIRAGALIGDKLEVYGTFHLLDEADGAAADGDDYEGKMGLMLSASYLWDRYRLYGSIFKKDAEFTPAGGSGLDFESTLLMAGAAHVEEFANRSMMFYFGELQSTNMKRDTSTTVSSKIDILQLALGFGMEGQVADWLTLRGSVAQATLLNSYKNKTTGTPATEFSEEDSTSVAAGMTLHFDAFKLDGSFTTSGGTLTGGNIMSRVAMSYVY
jgi:hypothetical protein